MSGIGHEGTEQNSKRKGCKYNKEKTTEADQVASEEDELRRDSRAPKSMFGTHDREFTEQDLGFNATIPKERTKQVVIACTKLRVVAVLQTLYDALKGER